MRGLYHFLSYTTVGFVVLLLAYFNLVVLVGLEWELDLLFVFLSSYPLGHLVQAFSGLIWSNFPKPSFNIKEAVILQSVVEEFTIYDAEGKEIYRPSLHEVYRILYILVCERSQRVAIFRVLSGLHRGLTTVFFMQTAIFVGYLAFTLSKGALAVTMVFAFSTVLFYLRWRKLCDYLKEEIFTLYMLSAKQTE